MEALMLAVSGLSLLSASVVLKRRVQKNGNSHLSESKATPLVMVKPYASADRVEPRRGTAARQVEEIVGASVSM